MCNNTGYVPSYSRNRYKLLSSYHLVTSNKHIFDFSVTYSWLIIGEFTPSKYELKIFLNIFYIHCSWEIGQIIGWRYSSYLRNPETEKSFELLYCSRVKRNALDRRQLELFIRSRRKYVHRSNERPAEECDSLRRHHGNCCNKSNCESYCQVPGRSEVPPKTGQLDRNKNEFYYDPLQMPK